MTRAGWFVCALLAGTLLASQAPRAWPGGPATLVLEHGDRPVRLPIRVNGGHQTLDDGLGTVDVQADERSLQVRVDHPDALALDAVRVTVELADGRTALVPSLRVDDGDLVAARRLPVGAPIVLGLLGLVIVLWLSEVVPLWVTSLFVPVALVTAGVTPATEALAPFFHPVIALFLAGFALAGAMDRSELDRRLAVGVVARLGSGPRRLYGGLLVVSAVASMFMSNTAAAAMLVPLAVAVTTPLGEDARNYRRAMVLGIAYAATLGGVGSAIGTPANPLAIAFLEETGRTIGFVGWFAYGLPMVVLFLPVVGAWVWWRLDARPPRATFDRAAREARTAWAALPPISSAERRVSLVFGLVVVAWLTDAFHGVHAGIVGLMGVVLLHLLGQLDKEHLGAIDWSALLTFGGGLTLGLHLTSSGASDWLATRLELLAGLPGTIGVFAMGALALGLTAVASNTASAAILIPLAVPLSSVLGLDPALLVMVVAVASSIDFALVIGTPPTMVAYSTGELEAGEIFRIGILLDLLGLFVLVTVVVQLWGVLGLL